MGEISVWSPADLVGLPTKSWMWTSSLQEAYNGQWMGLLVGKLPQIYSQDNRGVFKKETCHGHRVSHQSRTQSCRKPVEIPEGHGRNLLKKNLTFVMIQSTKSSQEKGSNTYFPQYNARKCKYLNSLCKFSISYCSNYQPLGWKNAIPFILSVIPPLYM